MKDARNVEANKVGVARNYLQRMLAARWVRLHHPDIWSIVVAESEKTFPRSGNRNRTLTELPESLRAKAEGK